MSDSLEMSVQVAQRKMTEQEFSRWLFGVSEQELTIGEQYEIAEGIAFEYQGHHEQTGFQEQWAVDIVLHLGDALVEGIAVNMIYDMIKNKTRYLQIENNNINSKREFIEVLEGLDGVEYSGQPRKMIEQWNSDVKDEISRTYNVVEYGIHIDDGIKEYRDFRLEIAKVVNPLMQLYDDAPKEVREEKRNQIQKIANALNDLRENVNVIISCESRLEKYHQEDKGLRENREKIKEELQKEWEKLNKNHSLVETEMAKFGY